MQLQKVYRKSYQKVFEVPVIPENYMSSWAQYTFKKQKILKKKEI